MRYAATFREMARDGTNALVRYRAGEMTRLLLVNVPDECRSGKNVETYLSFGIPTRKALIYRTYGCIKHPMKQQE